MFCSVCCACCVVDVVVLLLLLEHVLDHLELWYEHLAQAAMHTLNEASVDALEAALHDAPPWPTPGRGADLVVQPNGAGEHIRVARAAHLAQWLHSFAVQELVARLAGCTLWWRIAGAESEDGVDIVRGLPDGAAFAALLSGAMPH